MNYVTLLFVDGLMAIHPRHGVKWTALGATKQTNLIEYAERAIDAEMWVGRKTVSGQAGEFPRTMTLYCQEYITWTYTDDYIKDLIALYDDVIPAPIKAAVVDWIIDYMDTDAFYKFVQMQAVGVSEFTAGSVSFTFGKEPWKKPLSPLSFKRSSYMLLGSWTSSGGRVPVVRL